MCVAVIQASHSFDQPKILSYEVHRLCSLLLFNFSQSHITFSYFQNILLSAPTESDTSPFWKCVLLTYLTPFCKQGNHLGGSRYLDKGSQNNGGDGGDIWTCDMQLSTTKEKVLNERYQQPLKGEGYGITGTSHKYYSLSQTLITIIECFARVLRDYSK